MSMVIMAKEQLNYVRVFYNSLMWFELVIKFPLFYLILWDLIQSMFVGRRTMELHANMGDVTGGVQAIMKDNLAVKTGHGIVFTPYICTVHRTKSIWLSYMLQRQFAY